MTTHLSEDTAMRALEAVRPTPDSLDEAWTPTRSDRVLHATLDQTTGSPRATRHVSRRWALVAAVAGIATIGLVGQAVVPSGSVGSATAAQALDRLANRAVAITIPDGKFLKEVTTRTVEANGTFSGDRITDTTWYSADGWRWSTTSYSHVPEVNYVRDKWPANEFTTLLPQPMPEDPAAALSAIKQRAADYAAKHSDKANPALPPNLWVVAAANAAFQDVRTSAADRALLIRCLGLLPDVSVDERATDPQGRAAVKVAVTYQDPTRPSTTLEYRLFLDEEGLPLASQFFTGSGQLDQAVITERNIVGSVPGAVVKVLGSGHKTKAVTR